MNIDNRSSRLATDRTDFNNFPTKLRKLSQYLKFQNQMEKKCLISRINPIKVIKQDNFLTSYSLHKNLFNYSLN